MNSKKRLWRYALLVLLAGLAPGPRLRAQDPPEEARELFLTVGKALVLDSPRILQRISVANEQVAEAVAATPREAIVIGRAVGETTLILWQEGGVRIIFDLHVRPLTDKTAEIQAQIDKELGPKAVRLELSEGNVFVRGTVNDAIAAERALAIAGVLGKPLNLLSVKVPAAEAQILLKVRFADVDRGASNEIGMNLFSLGAANSIGSTTTGQFPSGRVRSIGGSENEVTLTDALNILLFRPDLNLGATIKALESKRLLQVLAEPNLLTMNGRSASFLAGGEFPYPTLQGGGGGLGAVTIMFREFGIRLNFTPTLTPRGTIHMRVTPEVSTLDYANGLTFQGFTIPGVAARRVTTEIELQNGQSFAIGGLLDNRLTETLNKIPGLGDLPFFGRLFRSRNTTRSKTELLVLVTPELVRPIPEGMKPPGISMPKEFMQEGATVPPRTPGLSTTGPVPVVPPAPAIPYEQLKNFEKIMNVNPAEAPPVTPRPVEFVPTPAQKPPDTAKPATGVSRPGGSSAPGQ
jgi:pilus assembly protein CpaC